MASTDKKGSVINGVVDYIKKNIQNGTWMVGDKIPSENQLCKELGVSRMSVRAAIQQFIALGVLESQHGKGTFLISEDVSLFTPVQKEEKNSPETMKALKDILDFRSIIEPEICLRVAPKADQEFIDKLNGYLDIMRESVGQAERFVEADMNFHLEICRACDNPMLYTALYNLFHHKKELGPESGLANGYYGGIYYHAILVNAFRRKDAKMAHDIMREHLERGIYDLSIEEDVVDQLS